MKCGGCLPLQLNWLVLFCVGIPWLGVPSRSLVVGAFRSFGAAPSSSLTLGSHLEPSSAPGGLTPPPLMAPGSAIPPSFAPCSIPIPCYDLDPPVTVVFLTCLQFNVGSTPY